MGDYSNSILAIAAATCLSELSTHPFEVLKVRSQVQFNTTGVAPTRFQILNSFVQKYGLKAVYKGLSAGIVRAVQNQIIRLYLYETLNKSSNYSSANQSDPLQQLPTKFCSALISSCIAGLTGNPWAVVKVRMITDKTGESGTLKKAFLNVIRQDGYREFTKGTSITILRGVLLSSLDLTIYDTLKHIFKTKQGHDQLACLSASLISSFTAAFCSYPLDVLITLHMNEHSHGKAQNRGLAHIWKMCKEITLRSGVKGFYFGFSGYASRSMVYGPVFWNSLELFNHLLKKERMRV